MKRVIKILGSTALMEGQIARSLAKDGVSWIGKGQGLNIDHAIITSRIQRITGGALLLGGALFYFVALLLFVYRQGEKMASSKFLWQLGALIQNLVADIYNATHLYIGFFWDHAPTLTQEDLFSYGNLLFLGLVGVMITGKQLVRSGQYLRRRVDRQLERIEELQWRQNAHAQVAAQQADHVNYYQASMPSAGERDWWQEPWGVVGLSIISGYAVAVLVKISGLA